MQINCEGLTIVHIFSTFYCVGAPYQRQFIVQPVYTISIHVSCPRMEFDSQLCPSIHLLLALISSHRIVHYL